MFKYASISTQFAIVFILALALVGSAFYLMLDRIYLAQLKSQAETVADKVDAFGNWVAQYGRVWVKDDNRSFLGRAELLQVDDPNATPPATTKVLFYSKNPALAQREFSEVIEKSASPSKFRLTSHNVMNPANQPDAFEQRAIDRIRADGLKDFSELTPDGYRFARTLYHKASCIACHGDPNAAPEDVKVRYGTQNGFGFKDGDVAGIISVRLPAQSFWDLAVNVVGVPQIAMILAAFVFAMLFIRYAVVVPVRRLTDATRQISLGKSADLGVAAISPGSHNELDQLALATERLRMSIQMAIQRLSQRRRDAES